MADEKSLHQKLTEISGNLWWSWQPEISETFRQIDPARWSELMHNPVLLLKEYNADRLEERATEMVLHSKINAAYRRWNEYMDSKDTWGQTHADVLGYKPVAYFSAEFGIH